MRRGLLPTDGCPEPANKTLLPILEPISKSWCARGSVCAQSQRPVLQETDGLWAALVPRNTVSHRLKIVLFKLFFFLSDTHLLWICRAPTEAFSLVLFPYLGYRGQGGHEPQTGRGVGIGASGWKGDNVWWCWWHWKVALAGGRCLQTDTDPQVSQPVPAPGPLPELPVWMSALSSFPAGCCWEFGCILNQIRLP